MRKLSWVLPLAVAAFALLLSSCGSVPKPDPVIVPCRVEIPQQPVYPFDVMKSPEQMRAEGLTDFQIAWEQVTTLLADRKVRIAYQRELKAAAESCQ
jgi:hypothetical protein